MGPPKAADTLAVVPVASTQALQVAAKPPNGEAPKEEEIGPTAPAPQDEAVPVEWLFLFLRKMKRERFLCQLVLYIAFIAIFTSICTLLRPVRTTFTMQDTIVERTSREAVPAANWKKTFYELASDGDWWEWAETLLLPNIMEDNYYNGDPRSASFGRRFANTLSMYNTQTAVVRFRQARVTDNSCNTPSSSSELSRPCWGRFTEDKQYKEAFGNSYGNRYLTGLNGISGKEGFGSNYGTEAHVVDLPLDKVVAMPIFAQMKQGLWLNEQTRAISVETNWYNANLDLSTYCRWHVDFSPGGRLQPYVVIKSCRLFPYSTDEDYFRAGLEFIFICMLIFYIFVEVNEWYSMPGRKDYFLSFWNWLEMANLVLYIVIIIYWMIYIFWDKDAYKVRSNEMYESRPNLSNLTTHYNVASQLAAFNIIFSYVKLFKFLQMYPSLSILWRTLKLSMADTIPFLLVFVLFTVGFTFAAHWIFGYMMVEFHSWTQSFSTLLQALIGGLPFEDMKLFAPISAIIFAVAWILVMAMVLVNMFVAILTEWYLQVNEENHIVDRRLEEKTGANAQAGIITVMRAKIRSWIWPHDVSVKDGQVRATSSVIYSNNPISQSVSKYVQQGYWQDTEQVRKAVAHGKPFTAAEMTVNFRGDRNKAYDFLNLLNRLAGGPPPQHIDEQRKEQEQLQSLQQTVERLEGHLRLLRAALHETGSAPLRDGQALQGYLVDQFPEEQQAERLALAATPYTGLEVAPHMPGSVPHQ